MANPTCDYTTLTGVHAAVQGFSQQQYLASIAYLMALELKAIGGTDYTTTMTTTLATDTVNFMGQMDRSQFLLALDNIMRNNATSAGAAVPTTTNALNAATGCCFQAFSRDMIYGMILLLLCKLGSHEPYPQ